MENYKLTYRVIWARHSKTNGYPIYFKLKVKGCKPTLEHSGFYINRKEEWNEKKKAVIRRVDAQDINDALDKKRLQWKQEFLKDFLEDRENGSKSLKRKNVTSFFDYIKAVRGTNNKTKTLAVNILEFHGSEPDLQKINIQWCREYETFLREEKKYKDNSVNTDFKILRRVTNQALLEKHIKEKIIGKGAYAMPGPGKTTPEFLLLEERLKLLAGLDDIELKKKKVIYRALVYFMFSVYTGYRHSDLRKFDLKEHIKGDMLVLRTTKTEELVVYPIKKVPARIMEALKEVGPFRMTYQEYNNKALKEISKYFKLRMKLRSHIGRHSFGRLMVEVGVSESDAAWFMGIGITIVKIYYHITGKIRTDRIKDLVIL